jgi:hypothetical protein
MAGYVKITKKEFYLAGGFSNTNLVRVTRDGDWTYWRLK